MFQCVGAKAPPFNQSQSPAVTPLELASELINRYPSVSENELARLINLYRELSAVDMALMLSDEKLAPNLDRFSADHRPKIRTPFRQYAALTLYAALGMAAFAWAAAFAL